MLSCDNEQLTPENKESACRLGLHLESVYIERVVEKGLAHGTVRLACQRSDRFNSHTNLPRMPLSLPKAAFSASAASFGALQHASLCVSGQTVPWIT